MTSPNMTQNNTLTTDLGLQTILGTIQPCSYDAHKVSLIEYQTEKEFSILPKNAGADLIDCVSDSMELVGRITEIKENDEVYYTIQVRSYQSKDDLN